MNKEVTVEGMTVKTKVGSNLLISLTPNDANFKKAEVQTRSALLEPVSTIDGLSYFYTVNAGADGDALADVYSEYNENTPLTSGDTAEDWAHKTNYDATFNTTYGVTGAAAPSAAGKNAYGYVDYNFYLKATNTDTTSKTLDMTKCNLLYQNGVPTDKAWRAAMFVDKIGTAVSSGTAPESMSGTDGLKTILAPTGSFNQSNKSGSGTVDGVATGTTLSTVTLQGTAATVDTMTSGETAYYYVVVRVWLEGEDTTCTSQTYATLTGDYTLDLEFALAGGDSTTKTPVTAIGSVAADANLGSYVVTNSSGTTTTTKGGVAATIPSSGYTYKIGGTEKTYAEVETAITALNDGESLTVVVEATA